MNSKRSVVNSDLESERKKCTFNIQELTHLLDGGPEKTAERKSRGKLKLIRVIVLLFRLNFILFI